MMKSASIIVKIWCALHCINGYAGIKIMGFQETRMLYKVGQTQLAGPVATLGCF